MGLDDVFVLRLGLPQRTAAARSIRVVFNLRPEKGKIVAIEIVKSIQ